jgi:hypothetical protein
VRPNSAIKLSARKCEKRFDGFFISLLLIFNLKLTVAWCPVVLHRLYPVRTYYVQQVMRVDLNYINAILLNEQAQKTDSHQSGNSEYLVARKY